MATRVDKKRQHSASKHSSTESRGHAYKSENSHGHHDHQDHIRRLNRIVGQLQGVGRMLDEGRYCPDILMQTRAAIAGIKALEDAVLEGHLYHCVQSSFKSRNAADVEDKIEELMAVFKKRL